MAMDSEPGGRLRAITAAIAAELHRQGGDSPARVDVRALAQAVDEALEAHLPLTEGRRPEDLNATNDD